MPRNIIVYFSDNTAHQYNNAPDVLTPDDIERRTSRDYPNKTITRIDGGKEKAPLNVKNPDELDRIKKNAATDKSQVPQTYQNADWRIECSLDKMSDRSECTIVLKSNPRVQCNPKPDGSGSLYIGTPARQTPSLIYTRLDNDAATHRLPEKMEERIYAAIYPLNSIAGRTRLRVRIASILNDVYDFEINLITLQDAINQYLKIR